MNPVILAASFAQQVADCEVAHPKFTGETKRYLQQLDKAAPGNLRSDALDDAANSILEKARQNPSPIIKEDVCESEVLRTAKQMIDDAPCLISEATKKSKFSKEFERVFQNSLAMNQNAIPCIQVGVREPLGETACMREKEPIFLEVFNSSSPAAHSEIKSGDILYSVNGVAPSYWRDLEIHTLKSRIGSRLPVQIMREGKMIKTYMNVGRQVILPSEQMTCRIEN